MKRGTLRHKKLYRLAEFLGVQPLFAAGVLEGLWHWVSETAPNGFLGDTSAVEIAKGISFEGAPEALLDALFRAGWLDKTRQGVWVHDFFDHADYDTHAAAARKRLFFQNRQAPKLSKLKPDEKAVIGEFYANTQRIRNEHAANRALPKPKPKPKPLPLPKPSRSECPAPPDPAEDAAGQPVPGPLPALVLDSVSLEGSKGTSDSDSPRLDASDAKGNPKNFAMILMTALQLGRGDPKQLASDTTWFTARCTRILAGEFGQPKEIWDRCANAAKRIRGDPSFKNKAASFVDWFKREVENGKVVKDGQQLTHA